MELGDRPRLVDSTVDPEELVHTSPQQNLTVALARAAADEPGSPLATWGEKEFTQLGIESLKASLSQFMHGEQGAMMVAAKIVETVPWIDAKYYAATQTMDEARHTEVFAKYLHTKLGEAYPMSPYLEEQIDALISDSRWDIAYLGMQIVIESLALAAFGSMLRATEEPLLKKLLRYVMSDEARHVAFGIISLAEYYKQLTDAELLDRQEFLLDSTLRSRSRSTTPEIWERMGTSIDAVLPSLTGGGLEGGQGPVRRLPDDLLREAGAERPQARPPRRERRAPPRQKWGEAGLIEFEFADDTASDYEAYDEVAKDRAAAR